MQILNNSPTNDVHLNSLSWIPAGNVNGEAIIVHTRSTGIILGISPENGEILWTINSGGFNGALFANGLDTSGITAFENGAHTVCVTDNSKFVGNTDVSQGKFVLSLFDNRSCVDPDGQAVTRAITADATAEPYQTDPARVMFYAVNLTTNTVTQAQPSIDLPSETVPQITDFMGAVFDHNDYYSIYTNHARSFFISDVNGEIIATVYDVICSLDGYPEFSGECYRARLFAESELNDLIGVGYKVANT